jgi:hypothetical protein
LAAVDVELSEDRFRLICPVRGPLLTPGERGAFDADGVTATSVVKREGAAGPQLYAYYLGWTIGVSVPFTNFIGAAIADSHRGEFVRASRAPILGRSDATPFTLGYPFVLRDGALWRMYFGSHLLWGTSGLEMQHIIKQAISPDGLSWAVVDGIAIQLAGYEDPAEFAVSRPSVLTEHDGTFSMWYARRRPKYELGYAVSSDAVNWLRRDGDLHFVGEPAEWENQERTYPYVFDFGGRRYMLYNGNGYGRTGIGLAVLER